MRDPVHRTVIESSRAFGALFGKRVVFVKSAQKGVDLPFNGAVRSLSAPRHIFVNAESPEVSPLAVAGHELTHLIRSQAPDLYKALAKVVTENSDHQSFDTDFRARFKGTQLTRGQIHEEMVADIVGNRILEPATWRAMAERDPNKFRAFATRVIAQLAEWIGKAKKSFAVDHLIVGDMEKIREQLVETLAQYTAHNEQPETKERYARHDEVAASAKAGGLPDQGAVRGGEEPVAVDGGPDQGSRRSLEGAPTEVDIPGRGKVFFGISEKVRAVKRAYAAKAGIPYVEQTKYVKVDRERATRIAAEYDKMVHDLNDPEVMEAYNAMAKETIAQYEAILEHHPELKIEFIDYAKTGDPYAATPRLAILDVLENNHFAVFSTRDGYGSSEFDPSASPMLAETQHKISGQVALVNDLFRVVHDYFGHIENGVGFRADGEENAWRSHSTMYSPLARRAMTSETRGQNSWVNFGPHGEVNRTANGADTIYADQKVGLMPAWVSEDGAFDDTQLSAKEREGDVISTRNPTGKTAKENAITQMLPIDLEAMQRDKAAFAHNVGIVTSYVGYRNEGARTPAQKAERFIEQAKGNLLWLHDAMAKELRDRAKLWYDGANKIARDFSRNYSISTRQASGILAALSPQKDWFQNVSLAKRVIEVLAQHQKTAWTPEMTKTADRLAQTSNNEVIDAVRGKKLGDLTDNVERAAWVRIFDETYNAKSYPVVTPEGNFEGLAQNGNGSATQVAWGGFNTIANAVSIYHDGSIENISARLGEQHKVRSFYNNIVAPKSEDGHVTIDTHAVAAALGRPLSGSSAEVLHNFGNNVKGEPGPTNSRIYGTMGTYGLYAEAYRRAAEERGILPREMQSITWEAVRGLFSPEFKRNQIQLAKNNEGVRARDQVDTIDHIWENYAHGDITAKQARSAVLKAAGGIATPEWAGGRPAGEVDGVAQHPGDAREVPVAGVPGRDAAVDGGTRSAAAAEPAAAVPEDVAFSRSQAQEDFADFDPLTDSDRPPYAGAKKHDGYWLSRDGQYVAAPAGGFGWTAVRVRDLPFMQEHGFGGSHLDRYLSGAIDRVAQGKDFSDVRAKFIKELKPLAPTDAKERAEMLAHFDAAMAAFQQGGVEFSRKFEPEALKQRVKDELEAALNSKRSVSLWDRTVGTKINLARKSPEFKAVFDKANEFIRDISYFAARAADQAPNLLPKLESVKTLGKGFLGTMTGERQANLKAAGDAIYAGTLDKTRYTGEELQRMGLSPEARTFYNEARAAVDTSLEQTGTSIMARLARTEGLDVGNIREMTMMKARDAVTKELRARRDAVHAELTNEQQLLAMKSDEFTKVLTPEALAATLANATEKVQALQRKYDALVKSIDDVNDVAGRVVDLQNEGYFPLMRFGDYTVYATQKNGRSTEQLFFGMYETEAERVKMARNLRQLYPNAQVVEGVANDEYHKLFAGINLDSLEVFAQAMGASEQEVFQSYLKLAVANRSALKRMIERKAVPGFDADVTRTLAQFLTSNARMASRNYHWAEAKAAANAIPKEKGDLQKEAVRLLSYIENPEEEGQTIRGLNFMWQMAGNISTAIINMMQPAQTTFPYLSRYGVSNATAALAKGAKTLTGKGIDADLARALKLAADKGITQPHEIHQLYGAQQRTPGVVGQRFGAVWQRGMRLMGEPFALAEAFNRHVTFVAAYEIGKQLTPAQLEKEGVKDAFGFAMKTVDDTQFVYNKANRPNWSRGSIQALIFQFKNYSISTVELFSHLARSGPEGRRAAAIMLGMWMLAAGFMGLPYEEDLEDLIDTVGQTLGFDTNIRASLRDGFFKGAQAILGQKLGEVFAEVMMHGASGALPLDVQGRFSLSNMIPATGVAKRSSANRRGKELSELLGPSGSLIDSMFKAIDSFQSGDGAPPQALPSYARNFAQFWDMIRTGTYRDDKGRSVVKTDKLDAAIKLLGFQPSVVAKEQRKLQVLTEQLDLQKVAEKDFTERIAKAVGDAAMVDTPKAEAAADREIEQTMADVERWNTRNPDTPVSITSSQIRKRVQEMMLERSTRLLKSAPREMRGIIGSHLNPED
ncbi:MAG: DUF7178 family protein [Usitatibacter sp.]